jgi:hypothetical protein
MTNQSPYGTHHDTQCQAGIKALARKQESPSAPDVLEALDMLVFSLSPRKLTPVLKAAGYSTDLWEAAHRNASALSKKLKR